ncbi:MAG TPA: Ig-like domain-containing protein, partial [Candidatus Blautia gallistercoris]|nr:Ig-like domain-containing protein [Candidatus Blautia gallistercoris]
GEGESLTLDHGANLNANGHNVIVDGGTLDEGIKNSLGDSVKYTPTITTASLSNGTAEAAYSTTLLAEGTAPITWSVTGGSLPEGLSLDASTGVISGIPTAEGVSTFTVTAANVYGSDSREFTLNIDKPVVIPVTGVKLDKTSLTLQETGSDTLTVTVEPDNATNKNANWESSDTSIATVDASGKVTAISAGSATITAIAADGSGKSASCSVTVYAATAITTQPGNVTVTEGSSATFTVAATGSNLTYQWQESTDGGSTWTDIFGASNSSYTIAATTLSMNHYQYRCKITGTGGEVTSNAAALTVQEAAIPVASVTLDRTNLSLTVGHTAAITAAVEPANATNKNVTWSSSPGGVVTLTPDPADSRKAIITAMGTGTATITAAAADGSGKSASCTVTVSRPYYPVTGITLDQTSLSMEKGDTARLHAAVTPSYATNPTVAWSSSDETVSAVDRTGRITALGGGTAIITARAGSCSAVCTVTVTVPVAGITLDQGSLELFPGGQAALTASLSPGDTTEQTVVWSSSNEAVAVVEEDPTSPAGDSGEAPIAPSASHTAAVTAVGKGTAVITAATADGAFSASCTVTVPGTPSATALTVSGRTTSSVTLSWDAVEEAEGYTIWYRSEYESSVTRKIIWDGDTASWTKTGLEPGTKYFFAIRSWVTDADGNYIFSDVSSTRRGTTKPEAAVIQSVTASGGYVKVRLAGEAEGARRYSICYGDSRNGFTENTFQVGIRTSYTVRTMTPKLEPGTYYICVKSYRDLGNHKRVYGDWSNIVRVVVR